MNKMRSESLANQAALPDKASLSNKDSLPNKESLSNTVSFPDATTLANATVSTNTGGDSASAANTALEHPENVILKLESLSKEYGDLKALDGVNLTVKRGEWLAIMGPSGSGKSTLMNIIGCMDSPSSGRAYLDGQDLSLLTPSALTELRRDKIGLVFQQFHLVAYLTALENVMLAQYYHSIPDKAEALAALEKVGLADRAKHLPAQLSGGEQQRVCIARALINQPDLLLADEPTGNLDEHNESSVLELFRQLHRAGTTIIVVTHDQTVGQAAERKIVLQHGKIVREELRSASADASVAVNVPSAANVVATAQALSTSAMSADVTLNAAVESPVSGVVDSVISVIADSVRSNAADSAPLNAAAQANAGDVYKSEKLASTCEQQVNVSACTETQSSDPANMPDSPEASSSDPAIRAWLAAKAAYERSKGK